MAIQILDARTQQFQDSFNRLTRDFEATNTKLMDGFADANRQIIGGMNSHDPEAIKSGLDEMLTKMALNQDGMMSSIGNTKLMPMVITDTHTFLTKLANLKDETGKSKHEGLEQSLKRDGLNSRAAIEKDVTKQKALLRLFFNTIKDRALLDKIKTNLAAELLKEETSEQIKNSTGDDLYKGYKDQVQDTIRTQKMHAMYSESGALGLQLGELFIMTINSAIATAIPSAAPAIRAVSRANMGGGGGGPGGQPMPVPGKPGQFIPV